MANAKDLTPGSLKVLLVGDAGTKKTILASTFPDPHFVDLDDGMLSVRGRDVNYVTIGEKLTTDADFIALCCQKDKKLPSKKAFLKAQALLEHWANTLTANQTLVLDSLTFYTDAALAYVLHLECQSKPRIQDWGAAQKLVERTLEELNKLPCHVVVTAHRDMKVDAETQTISYVPQTIGKLAKKIPAYFDEVWRTTVTPKKKGGETTLIYTIETTKARREDGKTRLNLPSVIEEPTFNKIMSLVTH